MNPFDYLQRYRASLEESGYWIRYYGIGIGLGAFIIVLAAVGRDWLVVVLGIFVMVVSIFKFRQKRRRRADPPR